MLSKLKPPFVVSAPSLSSYESSTNEQCYLSGLLEPSSTSLTLRTKTLNSTEVTGNRFPEASQNNPITIRVENEYMSYTGKTTNTLTGLTRNLNQGALGAPFVLKKFR